MKAVTHLTLLALLFVHTGKEYFYILILPIMYVVFEVESAGLRLRILPAQHTVYFINEVSSPAQLKDTGILSCDR